MAMIHLCGVFEHIGQVPHDLIAVDIVGGLGLIWIIGPIIWNEAARA